ncbi:MAG TPA: restriction endonuclease subunit S [Verrucomicrobiae bacterium]|nr:restriction endonuclease subunit S [Verrucomicrobiae bacterium]
MKKWRTFSLGEVLTLQRGFDLPAQDRKPGTVPIVTSAGISGTHAEAKIKAPGVVTGRYGTVGQVYYVTKDFWPHNTTLFVKDFKGNDPRFASYLLRTINFLSCSDKSSVPGVNRNHLHQIEVQIPDPDEQRAIANVLGTLDDKIELNRQMNETLEGLAQTLFKNWFVDAAATKLPKGWREGTLGEVAENPRRGIQPDQIKSSTPYIGLEHMPRRCIALSDWGHADELESNKFEFERGEILFGKLRPYFHKVGVAPVDGVCSTDILVVRPKSPEWFGFVLGHVSSVELVNHTNAASTGTKMPRASWNDVARFEVALPPESVAAEFTDLIRSMIDRMVANIHESRTLAELRDTLLPKLLSGELRVLAARMEVV